MTSLTLIDKALLLKRTPLFASLNLDLLLSISDRMTLIAFQDNDYIFLSNEEANRLYFIVKGTVEIRTPDGTPLATLEHGDFFGEESLFNHQPRCYTAYTPVKTEVLTLSKTNLYSIISECPSVALGFLHVYALSFPNRFFKGRS
jgi:CRP/FNR family transcriptional regulator, cyclic AMP receptor protein